MPIKLNGATNGSVELDVPAAVGSDLQVTLPATAGTAIVKATDGSVDLGSVDIDSSGRLLLGTTTEGIADGDNLTIADSGPCGITLRSGSSSGGAIYFSDATSGAGEYAGFVEYLHSSNALRFASGGTERMRIDSSGNVGVGLASPASKLHVKGGSLTVEHGSPSTGTGQLNINSESNSQVTFSYDDQGHISFGTATTPATQAGFSEKMRIDSSGNVRIGQTSGSSSKLSVYGSQVRFQGASTGTGESDGFGIGNNGATDAFIWNYENGLIQIGTNSTERMRIDSSGRLLVGATAAVSGADANGRLQVSQSVASNTCIMVAENTASSGYLSCMRARFRNYAPNNMFNAFLQCDDSSTNRFTLRSNGGLANYSANNANLSDRNAKKDITAAANTWDRVKEWEIVNYRYNDQPDDADLNLGVIAQQVNESCPEVVTVFQEAKEATETEPAQEERLGVKEQQMHWMAIKALQEAIAKIETLETKVAALEATS